MVGTNGCTSLYGTVFRVSMHAGVNFAGIEEGLWREGGLPEHEAVDVQSADWFWGSTGGLVRARFWNRDVFGIGSEVLA
jgi:hypothetical protein